MADIDLEYVGQLENDLYSQMQLAGRCQQQLESLQDAYAVSQGSLEDSHAKLRVVSQAWSQSAATSDAEIAFAQSRIQFLADALQASLSHGVQLERSLTHAESKLQEERASSQRETSSLRAALEERETSLKRREDEIASLSRTAKAAEKKVDQAVVQQLEAQVKGSERQLATLKTEFESYRSSAEAQQEKDSQKIKALKQALRELRDELQASLPAVAESTAAAPVAAVPATVPAGKSRPSKTAAVATTTTTATITAAAASSTGQEPENAPPEAAEPQPAPRKSRKLFAGSAVPFASPAATMRSNGGAALALPPATKLSLR